MPSPEPTATPTPTSGQFPNPDTTGVPAGWTPLQTRTTDFHVTTPGAVVHDIRLDNADLLIDAPNVTVQRVELRGGRLLNATGDTCAGNGLVVEDSTIGPPPGQTDPAEEPYVVGEGGYTLRRVEINNVGDGPRTSYKPEGCGPVVIEDSFIRVTQPPGHEAWHTDGTQAWYGDRLVMRNDTIDAQGYPIIGTSSAFFYPDQHNASATVDGLLVMGGAATFRLGEPHLRVGGSLDETRDTFGNPYGTSTVKNLRIVDGSWIYFPIDVKCSVISSWEAKIVGPVARTDSGYAVTEIRRDQPCNSTGGD
jgi:hypothetical protein